jgi:SpoVK/Ycf46/Vps4 family AAA+-type ATPase
MVNEEIIEKIKKEILNDKNDIYLAIDVIFDKYLKDVQREQLARHIEQLLEQAIQKALSEADKLHKEELLKSTNECQISNEEIKKTARKCMELCDELEKGENEGEWK